MELITAAIEKLFTDYKHQTITRFEMLPQSGSDRQYYRIHTNDASYIATFNLNIPENNAFVQFTNHFKAANLPVPEVFCVNEDRTIYIQEDKGKETLLDKLEQHGKDDYVY